MKSEKLRAVLALFEVPEHWIKESFCRDKDGQNVVQHRHDGSAPTYLYSRMSDDEAPRPAEPFCFCLDGGMVHCQCGDRDYLAVRVAIADLYPSTQTIGCNHIWNFNDSPYTCIVSVRKVVNRAIEIRETYES